jgi:hypothetical protein
VPGTCGKKSKIAGLDLPKSAVCKFFGFAFKTNFKSDYFSLLLLLLPSSEQPLSLPWFLAVASQQVFLLTFYPFQFGFNAAARTEHKSDLIPIIKSFKEFLSHS